MICINKKDIAFVQQDEFSRNSYGIYETANILGENSPHLIVGNSLINAPDLALHLDDNGVLLTDVIINTEVFH